MSSLWGYTRGMPKVSIYVPDELYQEARAHELPLSSLTQQAIEQALATARTNEWVAKVRNRPARHRSRVDTPALLESVREEFGQ